LTYIRNSPKVPQTETFVYKLQNHEETQVRIRTKHFKGPAPEGMITWAENDAALKKAAVDKLQRTHDRMAESGVDRDELAVLEARLNAAEAGVAAFAIIAPFDGVVADLNAKVGNSIKARETVVTVADFSGWLIETTDLTEIDVVNLAEDQAVSVKLDAIPDVELQGTILSIGQAFSENQGDVVYKVTILLADTHPAMRWGMTAEVKFGSAE
jgi:HlyD family secretion protein